MEDINFHCLYPQTHSSYHFPNVDSCALTLSSLFITIEWYNICNTTTASVKLSLHSPLTTEQSCVGIVLRLRQKLVPILGWALRIWIWLQYWCFDKSLQCETVVITWCIWQDHLQKAETWFLDYQAWNPLPLGWTWNSVFKSYEHNLWQRAPLAECNTHWEWMWLIAANAD